MNTPLRLALALALAAPVGAALHVAPNAHAQSNAAPQAQRGWLGVHLSPSKSADVDGVLVRRSVPGSPADSAGLRRNDVIYSVDGVRVRSPEEIIAQIGGRSAGDRVLLELRGPNPRETSIALSAAPSDLNDIPRRMIGRALPTTEAQSLETGRLETVNPADGKVRVVELWATWCGPCRTVQPEIQRFVESMDAETFEFVAVASEDAGTVRRYLESRPVTYRVLADPEDELSATYWTTSTPTFILVDRAGQVVEHKSGIQGLRLLLERARALATAPR